MGKRIILGQYSLCTIWNLELFKTEINPNFWTTDKLIEFIQSSIKYVFIFETRKKKYLTFLEWCPVYNESKDIITFHRITPVFKRYSL